MKNFVQLGNTLTLVAPYAVASGAGLLVGAIFGVASYAADLGEAVEAAIVGVFDLPREAGGSSAWSAGDLVYWDDTEKRTTLDDDGNPLIGVAVAATADGDAIGRVRLNGAFGIPIEEDT